MFGLGFTDEELAKASAEFKALQEQVRTESAAGAAAAGAGMFSGRETVDPYTPRMTEKEKAEARKKTKIPGQGPGPTEPYTGQHAVYQMQPPAYEQFEVADWTQPMFAPQQQPSTFVQGGTAAPTTILRLGPGQYRETSVYGPEVEVGAGIVDLYSQAAYADLERQLEKLSELPAQTIPVQEAYGPEPVAQMPVMASQQYEEGALESAETLAPVLSASVPVEQKKGAGWIWLVVAVGAAYALSRRGKK